MSAPDSSFTESTRDSRFTDLPRLPRDEGGPVFAEPWQAQVFVLAVKLSKQGHFTWKELAAELAAELKAAEERGEPDDGMCYYEHWLATWEPWSRGRATLMPAPSRPERRPGPTRTAYTRRQAGRANQECVTGALRACNNSFR